MPDREEALEGIAHHLKRFWEPRMRRALLAHVDQIDPGDTTDLSAIVVEAISLHRDVLG